MKTVYGVDVDDDVVVVQGKTLYEQLKANNEKINAVYEERMKAAFST